MTHADAPPPGGWPRIDVTVVCVLRSGGDFVLEHALALGRAVERNLDLPHIFYILSDVNAGPHALPLREDWPGWWAKLELFRPGLFAGPVLYFDLDTMLVGSINEIAAYRGPFAMLSDFYEPHKLQSGIMAWTPGEQSARLWERFTTKVEYYIKTFRGDGEFIRAHVEPHSRSLQDLFPGRIVSYKRDVCFDKFTFLNTPHWRVPAGARIVCFHGQPRPWQTLMWSRYDIADSA